MSAAVSILSWNKRCSVAALIGEFAASNAEFLGGHLSDLVGNVVLECEALESLDEASAVVLLEFRDKLLARGNQVMFRAISPACRDSLTRSARLCSSAA
jgi:anti-anti-sigma regulatory factor